MTRPRIPYRDEWSTPWEGSEFRIVRHEADELRAEPSEPDPEPAATGPHPIFRAVALAVLAACVVVLALGVYWVGWRTGA